MGVQGSVGMLRAGWYLEPSPGSECPASEDADTGGFSSWKVGLSVPWYRDDMEQAFRGEDSQ